MIDVDHVDRPPLTSTILYSVDAYEIAFRSLKLVSYQSRPRVDGIGGDLIEPKPQITYLTGSGALSVQALRPGAFRSPI